MGYTINSAKDSTGNEHLYVADFERNRAAIEAYKRQRGGDYEGAYRAITGRQWPDGRSVKFSNGRVELTKDRTVKSVMGKYVLPIGAAVAAPFVLPAVFGGAAGGATPWLANATPAGLLPSSSIPAGTFGLTTGATYAAPTTAASLMARGLTGASGAGGSGPGWLGALKKYGPTAVGVGGSLFGPGGPFHGDDDSPDGGPSGVPGGGETAGSLNRLLGLAENRIRESEPLFQGLRSHAETGLRDAGPISQGLSAAAGQNLQGGQQLFQGLLRDAGSDPQGGGQDLFQALMAMSKSQLPKFAKGGL